MLPPSNHHFLIFGAPFLITDFVHHNYTPQKLLLGAEGSFIYHILFEGQLGKSRGQLV